MSDILAPFDDETLTVLKEVDQACAIQIALLREDANKASLRNEDLEVDMEAMVWLKVIKAYGILYNRAIDAGWIPEILTENK